MASTQADNTGNTGRSLAGPKAERNPPWAEEKNVDPAPLNLNRPRPARWQRTPLGAGLAEGSAPPAVLTGIEAKMPQDTSASAPPPDRVFKDWLNDVARKTLVNQPDLDLERRLTSFLAERNDRQRNSCFGGYGSAHVPSKIDPSLARSHSAVSPHFRDLQVEPQAVPLSAYMRYLYMEGTLEQRHRAVDDEWNRGEAFRSVYRQGFDDGVMAERKRVAAGG
jgi:hypothetical protein